MGYICKELYLLPSEGPRAPFSEFKLWFIVLYSSCCSSFVSIWISYIFRIFLKNFTIKVYMKNFYYKIFWNIWYILWDIFWIIVNYYNIVFGRLIFEKMTNPNGTYSFEILLVISKKKNFMSFEIRTLIKNFSFARI